MCVFTVRKLEGICLPCLATPSILVDDQNLRFFLLGLHSTSSSQAYIISQWRITDSGVRCENLTPSLRRDFQPPPVPLPPLRDTATTYATVNGCEYILILGLLNATSASPEMKLIAVDPSTKLWFYIPVDCRMKPRAHASIVSVDNRLYVFGGQDECGNEISTYCIAECIDCRWHWIILERCFPSHVSSLGCNGAATLIQGGTKILLTSTSRELVRTVVTFDVASDAFEVVSETVGGSWSHVYTSTSLPPTIPTLRKRSVLPVPAIVICGQPASRAEGGTLEVWRYLLPPYNDLRRLNVTEQVRDLDLEMPFFVSVAGRHFLCGSQVLANVPHYDACIEVDVQRALDIQSSHVPNVLSSSSSTEDDPVSCGMATSAEDENVSPTPLPRPNGSSGNLTLGGDDGDRTQVQTYHPAHHSSRAHSARSMSRHNLDGNSDDENPDTSFSPRSFPTPRISRGLRGKIPSRADPERPHVCQYKGCHRAFKRLGHMERHINEVHLKRKPHQCHRCRSWFSRSGNLAQHIRTCTS